MTNERVTDWFAGRVAETYDGDGETERHGAVAPVVDFLEPYAAGGALELGIGTGRIALPLTERGVHVEGIDLSPDMVAQLRKKIESAADVESPIVTVHGVGYRYAAQ